MNQQKKRILVGGAVYGLHNIGDEAILKSIIESFQSEANISVMTFGSEWIKNQYPDVERLPITSVYDKPKLGLTAVPRKKVFSSFKNTFFPNLRSFKNEDLFLCGGATILSDCPWFSLHLIEQANKCAVPSVLWGVGMATVKDEDTLEYIRKICNAEFVKHIYTRDEFVKERIVNYGIEKQKVSVCYDPVYMLHGKTDYELKNLSDKVKHLYSDERPNICISISGEQDVTDAHHIEAVKQFVVQASETMNIFLIPTGLGKQCRDKEILESLEMNERTVYIDREFDPEELIAFFGNVQVIISSRLHCSILGADAGVPSINLIRNTKQEDFAKLFDLPALEMDVVSAEQLTSLTNNIINNRSVYNEKINAKINDIRQIYKKACCDLVSKCL